MRGRVVKLYEEDQDLLEDVLIEVKQAVDMSGIYLDILSSTMESFASLISNNLNMVMKVLASITLIISIPTVISGYYGMNVDGIPAPQFWFPSLSPSSSWHWQPLFCEKNRCYNSYNCMPRGLPAAGFFLCEEVFL